MGVWGGGGAGGGRGWGWGWGGGGVEGDGAGHVGGGDVSFPDMDREPHFGSEPLFEDKRARILVWYVLPGLLVVLLAALIASSRWNLEVTLYVFGQADPSQVQTLEKQRQRSVRFKHRRPVKHPAVMLRSGGRGAVRMAVYRRLGSKFLHPLRGSVRLVGKGRSWKLFDGKGVESLEARFSVPRVTGTFKLLAKVHAPGGLRKASVDARVVEKLDWPRPVALETAMTMPRWDRPEPDRDGTLVELTPRGGWSVPGEVATSMTVRVTDASGRPKSVDVRVGLLRGLSGNKGPGSVLMSWRRTGPDGLASFQVMSRKPLLMLVVEYRASEGRPVQRYHFQFATRPVQASLLGTGRVTWVGKSFVLEAHSVLQTGVLYLDGYHDGTLTWMDRAELEGGKALFQVPVPDHEGLWFLQVYSDLVEPGQSVSTWVSYVLPKGQTMGPALASRIVGKAAQLMHRWSDLAAVSSGEDAAQVSVRRALAWEAGRLKVLADWVAQADAATARRVVEYALGRLDGFSFPPEMLADTLPAERQAIASRRHRVQILLLGFFFMGLVVFLALLGWVLLRQVRAGRMAAAEIERLSGELDDGGVETAMAERAELPSRQGGEALAMAGVRAPDRGGRSGRWTLRLQTMAVVFVILFAIVSVIVLLTNLMWGM